jgi:hypothetical protein
MLTTTTTTTIQVEAHTPHPAGTVVDVIRGTYEGHIGRVKRYTAQRVVITLYPALGRLGSKKTINKEVAIKKTSVKARKLDIESTYDDESLMKPSNIKARKLGIESTYDDESLMKPSNIKARKLGIESTFEESSLFLLASLVASEIERQQPDCKSFYKNSFLTRLNELLEGTHPE